MPRRSPRPPARRGTVLPFLALTTTALFGFVALAIDIGMLAVARTQCQNAADSAALVGTRNLDNKPTSTNSNRDNAYEAARAVVTQNVLHAASFGAGSVESVRFGVYRYNATAGVERFEADFATAPAAGQSYTATEVVVAGAQPAFFGRVFGSNGLETQARAVAVHRPRDIAMVMDLTGSMRFGSMPTANGAFLSADPVYPQFGHWARYKDYLANNPNTGTNLAGGEAGRHNPFFTTEPFINGDGELYAPSNYTVPTAGGPAAAPDFYYDPANLSNPSAAVTSPSAAMVAAGTATPLPAGFHNYDPVPASPGDPDNYIAPTYTYGNWSYDPNGLSHYPCPESFKDQSHPNYLGDEFPRKRGREQVVANTTAWSPAGADGAAVNLAEYLGWWPNITTGAAPDPNAAANRLPNRPNITATGRDWSNFRDRTWEENGYDLNVNHYVTTRGGAHDPRNLYAGRQLKPAAQRFKGYSMGPGYWGKTFFMWPPDPRAPVGDPGVAGYVPGDWRRRFFTRENGTDFDPQADNNPTGGTVEGVNEVLLTNGNNATVKGLNAAGGMRIDYRAVLRWIKQPPLALPPNLRAGRVLYYSSIPDDVTGTGADGAFWRGYIDYVLTAGGNEARMTVHEGRGWPNGATPGVFQSDLTRHTHLPTLEIDPRPYMHYLDNPSRPRAQFWFGPVSMMAYLANGESNSWAGTVHETQTWQLKAGMNSALDDIRNNHPNDSVGMAYFTHVGYGRISVALGQEWQVLKDALFYPQSLIDNGQAGTNRTAEFRAFNTSGDYVGMSNIPNGNGGTDPNTGLAMGFNILSPNTGNLGNTRRGSPPSPYANPAAPRSGRRGAAKIIVFETDGVPNSYRGLTFNAAGYNSYYSISGNGQSVGNGAASAMNEAYAVVDKVVTTMATTTGGNSGLSSPNSPARVYAIGFGDLFSTPSATFQPTARAFLLNVQKRGRTSSSSDSAIPASQIITGPFQTRIDSLRTCFERIMQSGVQVTLIE